MHREKLMSPDLLSEMVLLVFGAVIFVSVVLLVMTAISRASSPTTFPGGREFHHRVSDISIGSGEHSCDRNL